ncbi:MAG: hypothetical protein ACLQIB_28525 [Isosphaeraceae bacterium]
MSMRLGPSDGNIAIGKLCGLLAFLGGLAAVGEARGQAPVVPAVLSVDRLLQMCPAELEAVYRHGCATAIPGGPIKGTALLATGTPHAHALSRGSRLIWQGKVFEPCQSTAVNRFFCLSIIRGQVYSGCSWHDGAPALILDYCQTSLVYKNFRDEIRQVAPGLYLGLMHDRTTAPPKTVMYFALEACP